MPSGDKTWLVHLNRTPEEKALISARLSIAKKGCKAWNKLPPLIVVCKGCGKEFVASRKSRTVYCSRSCYLTTSNPSKNPIVIEKIRQLLRDPNINPSKRIEVRVKISKKLKGRDAYWVAGISKRPEVRKKISDTHKANWPERSKNLLWKLRDGGAFGYSVESPAHISLKESAIKLLKSNGYKTYIEKPIRVFAKWYIADVLGKKGKHTVVIECGDCKKSKLANLALVVNKVFHVSYKDKLEEVVVL